MPQREEQKRKEPDQLPPNEEQKDKFGEDDIDDLDRIIEESEEHSRRGRRGGQ